MYSTTASSRIVLFLAAALIACACLVSAAPVTKGLDLKAGSALRISILKKVDEDEDEETTSTSTKTHRKTKTSSESTAIVKLASKKKSKSSSSGDYSGDATYYNTGLGSCGWTSKESELIVALNIGQMDNGANSNNNPNCGRSITATGPKGSVTVKVVDTCPGCANGDLDLSPAAFERIADLTAGRVPISWSWSS
ncbi:RlpA-like double-psi beta-barrel-protein domain-containing protein-containing protein [Parasitella parasitica]|nr:RlpA-like double-psi beta-barrel-protein domain-containing protein-containing protein [Parasitella parasitica]